MSEYKDCSICGSTATPNSKEAFRVNCSNYGCENSEVWKEYGFHPDVWQSRPREDRLSAEIATLQATVEDLNKQAQEVIDGKDHVIDSLQQFIRSCKSENLHLKSVIEAINSALTEDVGERIGGNELSVSALMRHPLFALFVISTAETMAEIGGPNYVEIPCVGSDGVNLTVTILRGGAHTPHELKLLAEKERDEVKAENEKLREALIASAIKCSCGKLAEYTWNDEDGEEWVCGDHKNDHFYAHSPDAWEPYAIIRAALENN